LTVDLTFQLNLGEEVPVPMGFERFSHFRSYTSGSGLWPVQPVRTIVAINVSRAERIRFMIFYFEWPNIFKDRKIGIKSAQIFIICISFYRIYDRLGFLNHPQT
jgi:hypothetical protein